MSPACQSAHLYRQSQIFARTGIELSRSTLADWVGKAEAAAAEREGDLEKLHAKIAHSTSSGHPFHEHPAGHSMNIRPPS